MKKVLAVVAGPRSHMDASGSIQDPKENAELLRLGALLGHDLAKVMRVVQPEACRKWDLFGLTCRLKSGNKSCSNGAIVMNGCRGVHLRNRQEVYSRPATHYQGGRLH